MVDKTGEINFVGLAPGNYFLRAILQEYKFEPSTTTITIKEGQHEYVKLRGKKVSFSAYGHVREMSGLPVAGVIVEALSEQCDQHHSEAATTQDGSYRIRALKPNCQYTVSVKGTLENEAAPHCFPTHFHVQMTGEDLKGLDMIAAPYHFNTDVAVEIEFGAMTIPSSYRLILQENGEIISNSIVRAPVSVFYHNNLPRDGREYSVRVEPDRHSQFFLAKTVFFTADAPVHVVRVPITMTRRSGEVEISVASLFALPFFGIIALGFFNQGRARELLRSFLSVIHPSSTFERKRRK
ncbi:hypothetical protein DICVIV_02867 [Dictyocaulus viviparus]|uniref:Uncharacterized protein n=1 Tax=Dictyocaulus viviparus TaxID=29172 RepID=A0A0D8Y4S4_DICVI|nr:hypothetical protein DICVIV_02867 [Dictyocaulus viviparus]